ncbi:hypothetical protein Q5P01_009829 [Channa striata]|uniref:Alpha-2-macroglobulin-like n=1 Tax=Channa striata TaxID=64152 RepID=A0AA88N143_CHASR|nr:hypothetical protein Q5P01_009829 [Channa striata]
MEPTYPCDKETLQVSLEFSPSTTVPGEETTMQITADPDSLCGVSAVDRSVLIKEPGKILDADKVSVTPVSSSDYTLTALSDDQYTSCLCGNDRKTVSWKMAPSVLGTVNVTVTAEAVASQVSCDNEIVSVPDRGRIDVVTKSLIVKAEGTEMTNNYNWLLCPKGYQRQLNYKDHEGAYSTFGSGPGNTWLTAFVLRTFAKAQSFIYIDPTKIEESKTWLERKQRENGCFEQSGKLFHKRMKGGVSDEVTLSAYITAAFLEMNVSADDPVVNTSLSCLRESINHLSNTYATALLAYVFTLAGDMETRAHLLQHLDTVALDEGGFLHWSQNSTKTSASLSVEISSYVLLAKLSASPTAEDLAYSSRIVRWLTGQQNYYGGFSSTQVSLEFSPSSAVPGEETTMQITADPDSLCGVSAVDRSVLIKEPGKILDADKILNLLPVGKVSSIPSELEDPTECLTVRKKSSIPSELQYPTKCVTVGRVVSLPLGQNFTICLNVRRRYLPYPGYDKKDDDDAYAVFQNNGLKIATNLFTEVPLCPWSEGVDFVHLSHGNFIGYCVFSGFVSYNNIGHSVPSLVLADFDDDIGTAQPVVTVRTFFPETWIWDLVEVGESGTKDVSITVPDTITTWETEAFCLSPRGFGLAPRKEIKVFQPFFLELTLPYSIIRGEHFELKATVFNYLTSCIMVSVTPVSSSDYTLTALSDDQYTSCLCGNDRKTVSWKMAPSVLGTVNVTVTAEAVASQVSCDNEIVSVPDRGRIDVVTKSLIVKAEGTEMTNNYNWLLCPKGDPLTENIDLQLPENVIDGSARASISVLGDILGRALQNLDGLLRMPYGSGEQNMALLAPNIYILQYLKNTDQLTPAISEKATNFLVSGYQRQLNYKDHEGAYSTFGSGPGNTWLTAFVLRTFAKAQSFIYIDPTKIEESKTWLERKQRESGCFKQSGKLFHKRMKGGVSDKVTLSAYITAAFLEMNVSADDPVVNTSLSCLMESINHLSNTYTTALLAYVFTLAGDMETRAHLLQHLDTVALDEGGFLHWSQNSTKTSASLSVEISSYVLLAKLSASPTAEDLAYSSRIVRWLTGQQNYYGGFSSTQDTVVALQALARYATLVFSPEGSSTVTVQSPSGQLTFDVNQDNKLLYQEKMLQDVTGEFSLEVKGSACASIQISLHYNIPTPTDVITLSVKAEPETDCTSESHRPKLTLMIQSLYSGKEKRTNMVILDIKMLSGFVPHPESLKSLQHALLVDRVEQKEDHVLVYIREFPKNRPLNHVLEFEQDVPVENLKPAVVRIYDYYQPSDQAETEYVYPCASSSPK